MKLHMNFLLYAGKTRLRDWWKAVKGHFIEVQDAINELDTDITNEAATRDRVDTAIMNNLTDEISARIAAGNAEAAERERVDNLLFDNITDAAAAIAAETSARQTADSAEAAARQNADSELRGNLVDIAAALAAEKSAREAADTALDERVKPLEAAAHTHENKELLDEITEERVKVWDAEGGNKVLFRNAMYDAVNMFRDIYRAVGIYYYDGGYVNMTVIDKTIDGGDVTDTDIRLTIDGGDITERRKAENTAFATTEEIIEEWNREEE